jgi:hypothetical protein
MSERERERNAALPKLLGDYGLCDPSPGKTRSPPILADYFIAGLARALAVRSPSFPALFSVTFDTRYPSIRKTLWQAADLIYWR